MRKLAAMLLLAVALTGCGASDEDKATAEDFCEGSGAFIMRGMGIERYENPEGFGQCMDDALEVVDCLDDTIYTHSLAPKPPESCD